MDSIGLHSGTSRLDLGGSDDQNLAVQQGWVTRLVDEEGRRGLSRPNKAPISWVLRYTASQACCSRSRSAQPLVIGFGGASQALAEPQFLKRSVAWDIAVDEVEKKDLTYDS